MNNILNWIFLLLIAVVLLLWKIICCLDNIKYYSKQIYEQLKQKK